MKLHTFIEGNLEAIGNEWEAFARTLLPAAQSLSAGALRNHSAEILSAIARDMQTTQTEAERARKGRHVEPPGAPTQSMAAAHGALRQAAGFDIAQVVSEFRAMRSCVLALWRRCDTAGGQLPAIEEIARFNEAVDQALGESVQRYSRADAASRDLFLAVLGHDLRSPLQGIAIASRVLTAAPGPSEAARLKAGVRIMQASTVMSRLITDLLEFARSRLGRGIPIERFAADLGQVCQDALDAAAASHPGNEFRRHLAGDLRIRLDVPRMQQVLSNLLNNAVQHGSPGTPVTLSALGDGDAIVLSITNAGHPIPPDAVRLIFEPLAQVATTTFDPHRRPNTSAGLGLFIAREIVRGHHGTIAVQSSAATGQTVFTIRLPRAIPGDDSADEAQAEPEPMP